MFQIKFGFCIIISVDGGCTRKMVEQIDSK